MKKQGKKKDRSDFYKLIIDENELFLSEGFELSSEISFDDMLDLIKKKRALGKKTKIQKQDYFNFFGENEFINTDDIILLDYIGIEHVSLDIENHDLVIGIHFNL